MITYVGEDRLVFLQSVFSDCVFYVWTGFLFLKVPERHLIVAFPEPSIFGCFIDISFSSKMLALPFCYKLLIKCGLYLFTVSAVRF